MNRLLHLVLALSVMICSLLTVAAQSNVDTLSFKAGEVLDILLLEQEAEVDDALKAYFRDAFPVAREFSYQPQPGFRVVAHSAGNHRPELLILGKWSDLDRRERFLTRILDMVPDFHARRRAIWSYFGLRYFELQRGLSFVIERDKYHVATAYWLDNAGKPSAFYTNWTAGIQAAGGEVLCTLAGGKSPFGYQYNPDVFVLTAWPSEAAFAAFQAKLAAEQRDNIQHVNEFILQ